MTLRRDFAEKIEVHIAALEVSREIHVSASRGRDRPSSDFSGSLLGPHLLADDNHQEDTAGWRAIALAGGAAMVSTVIFPLCLLFAAAIFGIDGP